MWGGFTFRTAVALPCVPLGAMMDCFLACTSHLEIAVTVNEKSVVSSWIGLC